MKNFEHYFEENNKSWKNLSTRFTEYAKKFTNQDNIKVYIVNGNHVRSNIYTDFVLGCHWFIDPHYVPENEVWIDDIPRTDDRWYNLSHELYELVLMRDKNMDYDKAHEMARSYEEKLRREKSYLKQNITEKKNYDIKKGDTILVGKWRNSPAIVKSFGKDKNNQPTVKTNKGTYSLYKFRIEKLMK